MSQTESDARPAPTVREKLSWGEKRDRRRRRRKIFEEVLGWILVPIIIYSLWLGLQALGGLPPEAVDFAKELVGHGLAALR